MTSPTETPKPDDASLTRWHAVSETNATDARAKLADCLEALDYGDLRFAAELCQSAAAKLRTAAAFGYVDRVERKGEVPAVLQVGAGDDLSKLRFPCALLNRLDNAGIQTVGQLTQASELDLRRARGIGAKFITVIKSRLSMAGLSLDGEASS